MITLYGMGRSRALRCLWMLEEAGVPFEHVPTSFAGGGTRTPEFLKINPNGHVPALTDGDLTLCESLAINLYLARQYAKDLWPTTVEDEGRTYQWTIWAMTELEEPLLTCLLNRAVYPPEQRDAAKADDAAVRAAKPLAVLDGALAGRQYLLGDTFTVVDLNVAAVALWTKAGKVDTAGAPRVAEWLGRCLARPAFGRASKR